MHLSLSRRYHDMHQAISILSRIDVQNSDLYHGVVYYTTGGILKIVTAGDQTLCITQTKHLYTSDGPTLQH